MQDFVWQQKNPPYHSKAESGAEASSCWRRWRD